MRAEDAVKLLGGDEYAKKAVNLLLRYCEEGKIPVKEVDEELLLLLDEYRLAVPVNSVNSSLSWNMRLTNSDKLEIPYIIRFLFRKLKKDGEVNWQQAVEEYFKSIGEDRPDEFPEIFVEILSESENGVACGEKIAGISAKRGRDGGVVIAEMKGAGLISPQVGCGRYGRAKAPIYEINKFFRLIAEQ
jgi:hypothetical protein